MVTVYLDTSAVAKLLLAEPESAALAIRLQELRQTMPLVSSFLLHAELHCAALRKPEAVSGVIVRAVLSTIDLIDLERGDLVIAPTMPGRLRSADAIHLATALRVGSTTMIVYDRELATAASGAGLRVEAPSA